MQEIATQLQQVVVKSLEAFKIHNNVYPQQLVIFRDGVGDSQKQLLLAQEMQQFRAAIKEKEGT